jgi:hypothetical protein
MITFKQHIELSKSYKKEDGLTKYLDNLPLAEKIDVARNISEVYPLKIPKNKDLGIYTKFKVYEDVMELVLGQFIMIEQIITGKSNYEDETENDLALAKLILRPKHQEEFDNNNLELEDENEKEILNTSVTEVYAVLHSFLNNRDFILFKQFKGVFYEINDDDEDDEEEGQELKGEALFQHQWYWYSMVRMLAKEDITKYEEIYMLKMSVVMPEMSYLAQKGKIEAAAKRQAEGMRKL